MKGARSVDDIITKLLNIIPEIESKLILELNEYKNSLWNKAPEVLRGYECWNQLTYIMVTNIRNIDTEWKTEALHLFTSSEG